jgi:hypothetical protein
MVMMNMRSATFLLLVLSGFQPKFCSSSSPECSFSNSIRIWMSVKKMCNYSATYAKFGNSQGQSGVKIVCSLPLHLGCWTAHGLLQEVK